MQGFNRVILAGNLTRDPELRYTPSGTAIAKFGLAINRSWKDQSGEKKEEVTFVDVDAFGKQAELIGQYVKKGNPLLVEGRLKLDQWDDKKTSEKRSRLGVVLEGVTFLGSGVTSQNSGDFAPPTAGVPTPAPRSASKQASSDLPPEEDDVPF